MVSLRFTKGSVCKWTVGLIGAFIFLVTVKKLAIETKHDKEDALSRQDYEKSRIFKEGHDKKLLKKESDNEFINNEDPFKIPSDDILKKMTYEEITSLYHGYVDNVGVLCRNIVRLGKLKDGGWEVCHDQQYRPPNNCLVYSAGIKNDFSFDDAIAKQYGCEVHSFDPSMTQKSYRRSERVFFHRIGLSDVNVHIRANKTGWEMRTLGAIKQELGHAKRRVDVLKMDIEHWEWKVLPQAIASGFLDEVTTLDLELHSWIRNKTYIYEVPAKDYLEYLRTLRQLHQLGFRIFLTHKNLGSCQFRSRFGMMRTSCQEIAMVQTKMKTGM
ncbi:probable methyltransferase-like protein 24 isoform X1 [Haliotis cracherodii]|uniref:probable methyltransferase-like protein 24 isoform X1 n=1 Tax=Haliotis cracherodii TaxID=6455 RepID=UPI0039ED9327